MLRSCKQHHYVNSLRLVDWHWYRSFEIRVDFLSDEFVSGFTSRSVFIYQLRPWLLLLRLLLLCSINVVSFVPPGPIITMVFVVRALPIV